jgi:hypothetical protein
LATSAASAASFTVRRMPMIVETSTIHRRAASAWVISPAVIFKKIAHLVSWLDTSGWWRSVHRAGWRRHRFALSVCGPGLEHHSAR